MEDGAKIWHVTSPLLEVMPGWPSDIGRSTQGCGGGGRRAQLHVHRATTIFLAAQNNVPAVYSAADFVRDGGLLSYGPVNKDEFRRAALYVDRILRGAKPADLPVQLPTKFEIAVNIKTAKALGLPIPETLLATADEVIQ